MVQGRRLTFGWIRTRAEWRRSLLSAAFTVLFVVVNLVARSYARRYGKRRRARAQAAVLQGALASGEGSKALLHGKLMPAE